MLRAGAPQQTAPSVAGTAFDPAARTILHDAKRRRHGPFGRGPPDKPGWRERPRRRRRRAQAGDGAWRTDDQADYVPFFLGSTGIILLNPADACPLTKGRRHAAGDFQHGNDGNTGDGLQESGCTAERPVFRRRLARTDRTCKTSSRGRSKGTTRKATDLPYEWCGRHGTRFARRAARPKKRSRVLSRGGGQRAPPAPTPRPAPYRSPCGSRLTTIVCTSNSSVSTNAARPSGPNAMGIAATPSAKVPA